MSDMWPLLRTISLSHLPRPVRGGGGGGECPFFYPLDSYHNPPPFLWAEALWDKGSSQCYTETTSTWSPCSHPLYTVTKIQPNPQSKAQGTGEAFEGMHTSGWTPAVPTALDVWHCSTDGIPPRVLKMRDLHLLVLMCQNAVISFPGIRCQRRKTLISRDSHTVQYTAALLTAARRRKRLIHSPADERTKYTYTRWNTNPSSKGRKFWQYETARMETWLYDAKWNKLIRKW